VVISITCQFSQYYVDVGAPAAVPVLTYVFTTWRVVAGLGCSRRQTHTHTHTAGSSSTFVELWVAFHCSSWLYNRAYAV